MTTIPDHYDYKCSHPMVTPSRPTMLVETLDNKQVIKILQIFDRTPRPTSVQNNNAYLDSRN